MQYAPLLIHHISPIMQYQPPFPLVFIIYIHMYIYIYSVCMYIIFLRYISPRLLMAPSYHGSYERLMGIVSNSTVVKLGRSLRVKVPFPSLGRGQGMGAMGMPWGSRKMGDFLWKWPQKCVDNSRIPWFLKSVYYVSSLENRFWMILNDIDVYSRFMQVPYFRENTHTHTWEVMFFCGHFRADKVLTTGLSAPARADALAGVAFFTTAKGSWCECRSHPLLIGKFPWSFSNGRRIPVHKKSINL